MLVPDQNSYTRTMFLVWCVFRRLNKILHCKGVPHSARHVSATQPIAQAGGSEGRIAWAHREVAAMCAELVVELLLPQRFGTGVEAADAHATPLQVCVCVFVFMCVSVFVFQCSSA
jgi:hypothetical protein